MTGTAARIGGWTRRTGIAITVATLLAAFASASTAVANTSNGGDITATWSGRIDWTEVYDPNHPAIIFTTAGYDWSYSITVRSTASGGKVVGKPSFNFSGKITQTAAPPNQGLDCTGKLSQRPTAPANQFGAVGIVWESTAWDLDWFVPDTSPWVQSTGPAGSTCGGAAPPPCGPTPAPRVTLTPSQLPWTRSFAISGTGAYPKGGVDCWMSLGATLTFSGAGLGGSKPPPTPGRFRAKAEATLALQSTFERMLYPCIATAATIPLYGLGPPGQIAALGIGAVGGPLCSAYIKDVYDFAAIIKDPPLSSYGLLARPRPVRAASVSLPSCSRWTGSAATFCAQLESRLLALLAAAQKSQSFAAAMKTTIARESGALAAHNYAAATRQDRNLTSLDKRFASDEAAETAAGAAVASVMGAAGLPATLSAAQSASATSTVVSRLGHLGLSRRALGRILGALRTPAPVDWLAALSS